MDAAAKRVGYDFRALAERAAAHAPDDAEHERDAERVLRAARELRLETMREVLPEEDYDAIVRGVILPLPKDARGLEMEPAEIAPLELGLTQTPALRFVRAWHDKRRFATRPFSFAVMLGDPSVGKTLAAGWLLAQVGGAYVTAETLRHIVKSNYAADRDAFYRLTRTPLVIVDDAGTEQDEETAKSALFEFINARQGVRNGWTVIPGNLNEEDFRDRYDYRTIRRIEHQGAIVTVGGQDLRRPPIVLQ